MTAFFSNPPNIHLQNAPVPQAVCQGRHKHCSEWSTLYFHAHLLRMGHFCKEFLPATDICNSVNTLTVSSISIGDWSKSYLNNSLSTTSNYDVSCQLQPKIGLSEQGNAR